MNQCAYHYTFLTLGSRSVPATSAASKKEPASTRPSSRLQHCPATAVSTTANSPRDEAPQAKTSQRINFLPLSSKWRTWRESRDSPSTQRRSRVLLTPPHPPTPTHRHTAGLNSERGTGGRERNSLTAGRGVFSQYGSFKLVHFVCFCSDCG